MHQPLRIGVIGPGKIAHVVMENLKSFSEFSFEAVASRDEQRAQSFQNTFGFKKAYHSYDALFADPDVDLVYIATPHAFHYEQMMRAITYHKSILCEKAFCLTQKEAKTVLDLAQKHHLFVGEALCTAYLPSQTILSDLITSNIIGEVISCHMVFGNDLMHVERVVKKELGGGALLDIGLYPLYACFSLFGWHPQIVSVDMSWENEVDLSEKVVLTYPSGMICTIEASVRDNLGIYGDIVGTNGSIHIHNIARPDAIDIYDVHHQLIKRIDGFRLTSGYEYEFLESRNAMLQKRIETVSMPHRDTLALMGWMDQITYLGKR